ncbi:MAG: CTP-dependent riboflavin kinase [Deltaproteobacteria bacterium]|nr:CTP-dependent riboflavin kinase [Deltaproteobacteria bacterium]
MAKRITGVIFSDLGQGASFMSLDWVQKALRERLGFFPYPATLNLRLESEREMDMWREAQRRVTGIDIASPDSSFCQARCYLVDIERKHRGAVLLPAVEGYPADKIEVIAPVRLKDELHVRDGDRITLEFVD